MPVELWPFLRDVLILLATAMVLGAVCEWLKQSAIVGYLLAGTLLGPNALEWIRNEHAVSTIAELGVALLLFSIGLEFSWKRLRGLGAAALGAGSLQVVLTIIAATAVATACGLPLAAAVAVGAMIGLSSTAVVLRTLTDRAELDSVHGRNAVGILLFQDIAVVPLVLLVAALGAEGTAWQLVIDLGKEVVLAAVMVLAFLLASNYMLPRILTVRVLLRNRELPILFAVVIAMGSAWVAHGLGLSPALGAFIAGVVLGESPVATQIRADVGPLKTLFATLFFGSIGMLADIGWIIEHAALVAMVVAAVIVGKAVVIWGIGWLLKLAHRHAVAAGVALAQVGEFSFVLADAAGGADGAGVIDEITFKLMVAVTIATLFLTPYLISGAPQIGGATERWLRRLGIKRVDRRQIVAISPGLGRDHVVIIGFGPAGRAVAEALRPEGHPLVIIDLNAKTVLEARSAGVSAYVGDATSPEILELAVTPHARQVVITLPDQRAAIQTLRQVRALNPKVRVICRARYHVFVEELESAGAHAVVDEEASVGKRLGMEVLKGV